MNTSSYESHKTFRSKLKFAATVVYKQLLIFRMHRNLSKLGKRIGGRHLYFGNSFEGSYLSCEIHQLPFSGL